MDRHRLPRVTLVFCAHNEEEVLPDKIANCISLDYPSHLMEFCVGSDGSSDATNILLEEWARDPRVRLTLSPQRVGKTALLNRIVPTATGEVVLFSDASTLFSPEAVRRHVSHYADPTVGCVGGDLDFVNTARTQVSGGHGAYWRYERHLRQCESSLGILAYVAGANYSIRRSLWRAIAPHFSDDGNSPLNVIEQGYRVVYDPEATAREVAAESGRGLMKRRVRMVTRDLEAVLARRTLLNFTRFPGVAWSLWSHKLLRWFGAPLLVLLLITNLFLLAAPVLPSAAWSAAHVLRCGGCWLSDREQTSKPLAIPTPLFQSVELGRTPGRRQRPWTKTSDHLATGRHEMMEPFHLLSVDVEDWPQSTLDHSLPIGDRVVSNTRALLELFAEANVKATFFVLGKVAEAHPDLAREIAEAGHEVGTHGYSHRSVERLGFARFAEELHRSVDLLRQQTGAPVLGHRAADFSISAGALHLLNALHEEGLTYDSSIFPIRHPRYGVPGAWRHPHRIRCESGATLVEFPPATVRLARMVLPAAGGGYLRLFPYRCTHFAFRALQRDGSPATCYLHPYEIDTSEMDEIPYTVPTLLRWSQNANRRSVRRKLRKLLLDFRFITMARATERFASEELEVGLDLTKAPAIYNPRRQRNGPC